MKTNHMARADRAFSIVEMAVSIALVGVVFVSLYAGIGSGFSIVNLARENLRANQILVEKMETIRLYSWEQINSNGFIPTAFTASFFPLSASTNEQAQALIGNHGSGTVYYGNVLITNAPVITAYATNMKLVTVTLRWTNSVARVRELQTLVSRDGMQNYIYY